MWCTCKKYPYVIILFKFIRSVKQYGIINIVDGVVLIDPDFVKEHKVYGHVLAAFRYGREDLDVLGLTFRKDLYLASEQIYPPEGEMKHPVTRLQERLIKKLGPDAYPFFFEVSTFFTCLIYLL